MISFRFVDLYYLALLVILVPCILYFLKKISLTFSGTRKIIALSLRLLIIALLTLGLAGFSTPQPTKHLNLIFCLDLSKSISESARSQALKFIEEASEAAGVNDTIGLVIFGSEASLEISPQPRVKIREISSQIGTDATDIAKALELALASFPEEGRKRIILLSDGQENIGHALDIAFIARSLGVEIFTIPLTSSSGGHDTALKKILVPSEVKRGELFEVKVIAESDS
ncbi:MAG: VWA domain-containing protein, partial [Candidatus Tectomicrobia bacterium]|nr:VWA domain-containing protein [Candidatus Tectomicrobia bacterium]